MDESDETKGTQGLGRTGSAVPAVHTSPRIFWTCNGLEVQLLRQSTRPGTPVPRSSKIPFPVRPAPRLIDLYKGPLNSLLAPKLPPETAKFSCGASFTWGSFYLRQHRDLFLCKIWTGLGTCTGTFWDSKYADWTGPAGPRGTRTGVLVDWL